MAERIVSVLLSVALGWVALLAAASPTEPASNWALAFHARPAAPSEHSTRAYLSTASAWSQQLYAKASNTGAGDGFGTSIAISGDTVVVGSYGEASAATGVDGDHQNNDAPGAGAAYVFTRIDGTWFQQAYLKASNTDAGDRFGSSVAISGDTIVVGAPNEKSSATGVDGNQYNNDMQAAGAAYVFTRTGGTWAQQAYLKPSNTGWGLFGESVAISGDTIVVGSLTESSDASGVNGDEHNFDALRSGAAYVFTRSGSSWSQQAYLKASNTGADDAFGRVVGISGDTIVVGAPGEDSAAVGVDGNQANEDGFLSGAAYVFARADGEWSQQAYLKASNTAPFAEFGFAVSVSDDTIVVGAHHEESAASGVDGDQVNQDARSAGAAYVFTRSGSTWSQQAYLKASNTGAVDLFSESVGISGDRIVVGARLEDSAATGVDGDQQDNGATNSGAAYVFTRTGSSWSNHAYIKASNTGPDDSFGAAVAISGDTIAAAAPREDSVATGVNGVQADDTAANSGAAYVFVAPHVPPDTTLPVVTEVAAELRSGPVAGAPVRVSWMANDDVSAAQHLVHRVQSRQRTADGSWGGWVKRAYATGAQYVDVTAEYSVDVEFRVRTQDEAGNWSAWARSGPTRTAQLFGSGFRYTGSWTDVAIDGWGGFVRRSREVGATAKLAFEGQSVGAVMRAGAGQGRVRICVDPSTPERSCQAVNLAALPRAADVSSACSTGWLPARIYCA